MGLVSHYGDVERTKHFDKFHGTLDTYYLSIIICTRNRCQSLFKALRSIVAQDYSGPFEVLVIDNASDDGTFATVSAIAPSFPAPLRVLVEPRKGLSHARNRALREAKGKVAVFIDDDVVCHPRWLRHIAEAFGDPGLIGLGGRIIPVLPKCTPDVLRRFVSEKSGGPTSKYEFGPVAKMVDGEAIPHPFGANMAVRVSLARKVGGFRTDLGWGTGDIPGEDTEFFWRARQHAGKIVYCPEAAVDHHIDSNRMNADYFLKWYEGLGKFLEILEGRDSRFRGPDKCMRIGWRLLRSYFRLHQARRKGDEMRVLELLCARARNKGRLKKVWRVNRFALGNEGLTYSGRNSGKTNHPQNRVKRRQLRRSPGHSL